MKRLLAIVGTALDLAPVLVFVAWALFMYVFILIRLFHHHP